MNKLIYCIGVLLLGAYIAMLIVCYKEDKQYDLSSITLDDGIILEIQKLDNFEDIDKYIEPNKILVFNVQNYIGVYLGENAVKQFENGFSDTNTIAQLIVNRENNTNINECLYECKNRIVNSLKKE